MRCEMCNKELQDYKGLASHVVKTHKITSQDYYDKHLKHKNEDICYTCGKPTPFISLSKGYQAHCCQKCANNNPEILKQKQKTNIEHFGVKCYLQTDSSRNLCNKKLQTEEVKNKRKNTCQRIYGGNAPASSNQVQEKMKETTFKRFGVYNAFQSEEIQEKQKATLKSKYGVTNAYQIKQVREKSHSQQALNKHYDTMKKNGTFKTSKEEDEVYKDLCNFFNVERNHKTEAYPYRCDFYILEKDLYVECNFHWTHGEHWFDKNSANDVQLLEQWKNKNTRYFNNAINTWTIRDVEKRCCAKNNNLNYVVLWDMNEYIEWKNSGFEIRKDF